MTKPRLSDAVPAPAPTLLLSRRDLTHELRMSLASVDRLNSAGKLPKPLKIGGSLRWSRESIVEWIAANCPAR